MLNINVNTWIISDTHFLHKNIVKYCSRPETHTELMIENWRIWVQPDDDVLHLGDIFMGNSTEAARIFEELPGNKYFIRGNHDKKGLHWYEDHGFTHVGEFGRLYKQPEVTVDEITYRAERVCFSHYPEDQHFDWDINIHGHIHNNGYAANIDRDRDYRNVSVEVMDYRPWRLRDILYNEKYQASKDAPVWEPGPTLENGIILPASRETEYFG